MSIRNRFDTPRRGVLPAALLACIVLSFQAIGEEAKTAAADGPTDALAALNDASRAAYHRAKEEALAHADPVVLLEGDDLVLKVGADRTSVHVTPEVYDALKSVSHATLAVYSLVAVRGDGPLDEQSLKEIRQFRDLAAAAGKALAGHGLSEKQVETQKQILDGSVRFLDAVLDHRRATADDLAGYVRTMRPLLDADAADAARAEIDALHKQMTAWKAKLSDQDWNRLTVVVMGSQLPRKDNLAVQYFTRLLGEKGEGGRVVYSEAIWDEGKALDLVTTRSVDAGIGAAFFGDPERMHRDLLGDAAKAYLDELFRPGRP